jgi:hypothetical protein
MANSSFAAGIGSNPTTSTSFLSPTTTVTITDGQRIFVMAGKAFGSTAGNGASALDLAIGFRVSGSGATPTLVGTVSGNAVFKNERHVFTLSAIVSGLAAGTYEVGLAGVTSADEASNWNSNGAGSASVLVFN